MAPPRKGGGARQRLFPGFGILILACAGLYIKLLFFTDLTILCHRENKANAAAAATDAAQASLAASVQAESAPPVPPPAVASPAVAAPVAAVAAAPKSDEDPWPFIKLQRDSGGERWPWPAIGWKGGLTVEDLDFRAAKFFLYDEGVYDMRPAETCMRKAKGLGEDMSVESLKDMDKSLRVNEREYLTEFFLLPALRSHPQRTMNPEEADFFVLGYASELARMAMPCKATGPKDDWEQKVAESLEKDKYFTRNGGRDFVYLHSRYKWDMHEKLHKLLDEGSIIATFDRYSPVLEGKLPKTWGRGDVLVLPYVASVALDLYYQPPPAEKDPSTRYFFRGNMHRWGAGGGARAELPNLAKFLNGADFKEVDFVKVGKASKMEEILQQTAVDTRKSSICPAPEGDTPTSLRPFEGLVAGCIPVISAMDWKMARTLPFPSLIDWDAVALFTRPLVDIVHTRDGLKRFGEALESIAGDSATPQRKEKLETMRKAGMQAFEDYLSFFRNPKGVADAFLFETWVHVQMTGVLKGKSLESSRQ